MNTNFRTFSPVLLALFFIFAFQVFNLKLERPQPDSYGWYINYAESLYRTGTFGHSGSEDKPSNVISPLYPALLSGIMFLDENVANTFHCFKFSKEKKTCEMKHESVIYVQMLFAVLSLFFIWLIAYELTGNIVIAWLSLLAGLLSGQLQYFANHILTESLAIPLQCMFVFGLVKLFKTHASLWFAFVGINLGLLTLVRPEYLYIFFLLLLIVTIWMVRISKPFIKSLIFFMLGFVILVAPWSIRNQVHFDSFSLTDNYGERVLAQRLAYNRMSWQEWGVAFIYWFPDFGDSLSKRIFDEKHYRKLDFSPESYYQSDAADIVAKMRAQDELEPVTYLLKTHVYNDLFKHVAVSLPLAWRGIFVSKYWGILGAVCLVCCLLMKLRINKRLLIICLASISPLLALYAGISVSVPRYYLILIPFYSVAIGTCLEQLARKIYSRIKLIYACS